MKLFFFFEEETSRERRKSTPRFKLKKSKITSKRQEFSLEKFSISEYQKREGNFWA